MTTEHDDRSPQKDKKDKRDIPESSKSRDRKRKSDDMVTAADCARQPRPPRPDDYRKLMDSPYPFHPKGKHAVKDCYALKRFTEENIHHQARNQDDPDRNQGQHPDGSGFPDAQRELHMIYGGSAAYESKRKQKLTTREINALGPATPSI